MSRTIRHYPSGYKQWRVADKNPVEQGRDGALKLEKHLKRADRYTGWTDDGIWTPEAKRRNKRKVSRENRHKADREVRSLIDDEE